MEKSRNVGWDYLAAPMKLWLALAVIAQAVVLGMHLMGSGLGTVGSVLQAFAAVSVVVIILDVVRRVSRQNTSA